MLVKDERETVVPSVGLVESGIACALERESQHRADARIVFDDDYLVHDARIIAYFCQNRVRNRQVITPPLNEVQLSLPMYPANFLLTEKQPRSHGTGIVF